MILVDTNILMDVFVRREPHFGQSARLVDRVANGRIKACVAAHGITTLHYLVEQMADYVQARNAVDWTLQLFSIAPVDQTIIERARSLDWRDFEDAAIAAAAESAGCTAIITRNARDFVRSPVPAMAPEELVISEIHESFVRGYAASRPASQ